MSATLEATTLAPPDVETVKGRFAEHYPRIHRMATFQHRRLRGDRRDDAVAETIGRTWKAYRDKALNGENPDPLLGSMVRFAAMHVRAGKLVGRSESRDVLSRQTRSQNGHRVTSLPTSDQEVAAGEVRDALRHRVSGPAAEAISRVDHADWLASLSDKQREVAEGMREGRNLTEIAERRGSSKAAVQQIASRLRESYDEFHGR